MKKTLILSILVFSFSAFDISASTPLNWCKTELTVVREKVMVLDPEAIEIVDGYTDLDSIENVQTCEAMLSETEGLLEKACATRQKLNKLIIFENFINKESSQACKDVHSALQLINEAEMERASVRDPGASSVEEFQQIETTTATTME